MELLVVGRIVEHASAEGDEPGVLLVGEVRPLESHARVRPRGVTRIRITLIVPHRTEQRIGERTVGERVDAGYDDAVGQRRPTQGER